MIFRGISPREWWITLALLSIGVVLLAIQTWQRGNENRVSFPAKQGVMALPLGHSTLPKSSEVPETTAEPSTTVSGAFVNGQLNLNAATQADLESLPGIGPAKAKAILEYRASLPQGFTQFEQLDDVSGFGEKTLAQLKPLVFVAPLGTDGLNPIPTSLPPNSAATETLPGRFPQGNTAGVAIPPPSPLSTGAATATNGLININTAGVDELQKLNGIGVKKAEAIVKDRQERGPYRTVDDLQRVTGIGPKTVENNRQLMTTGF
ncbi:MAG: ComEA family DNA-binding protein [Candidatus Sumerlaeia bacterium]|nr:ComEA family DNA-binding protein [Candidatus Sumerlaeia bacterium]